MSDVPPLAGRFDERSALNELIRVGGVVVLSGEPGSGKTTLLQWARRQAETSGRRVVSCRPAQLEAAISFSALSDFLADLTEEIAELPEWERTTLRTVCEGASRPDRSDTRQALTSLLGRICESQPSMVVIDDMQWMDEFSSDVLSYAIRRAVRGQAVLASFRTGAANALADSLLRLQPATTVVLGPMREIELAEVAAAMLGGPTPACLTISHLAHGSPLRARELARVCRSNPASILQLQHIARDVNPFRMSVQDWPLKTLQVLFAALHMRDGRIDVLRDIFGSTAVEEVLADEQVRLLTNNDGRCLTAGHSLFADAVSASLTLSERAQTHGNIVAHISDSVERARHLSLSNAPVSIATAERIMAGSRMAHDRGSTVLAHQLASRVTDFLPEHENDERSRAQIWLAHMEYRQDEDASAAARLLSLVDSIPKSATRIDAELMLANIEAWSIDVTRGVDRYLSVLGDDTASSSQHATAAIHLAILSLGGGSAEDALSLAQLAVEVASPIEGQLLAEAEAVLVAANFFTGRGLLLDVLDRALQRGDLRKPLSLQGPPLQWAPFIWVWCGDSRAFQGFIDRRRFLSSLDYASGLSLSLSIETRLLLEAGRRNDAKELVRRGREMAEFEHPIVDAMVSIAEARLRIHVGADDTRSFEKLDRADEYLDSMAFGFGWIESATVRMAALVRTDISETIQFGLRAFDRHRDHGIVEPAIIPGIIDLIEAMAMAPHPREQEVFHLFDNPHSDRPDLQRLQRWRDACLEGSRGDQKTSHSLVRFADDRLAASDQFWAARALLHAGRCERREGRRKESRLLTTQALALFRAIDAEAWSSDAALELSRVGPRAPAIGALTNNEQQIAGLASEGMTNKQIAAKLFVSEKTVEAVLSAAYRKLGIARRSQLSTVLGDQG